MAAPEDVIVALWDGELAHQLTFEWCDGWRCAARTYIHIESLLRAHGVSNVI